MKRPGIRRAAASAVRTPRLSRWQPSRGTAFAIVVAFVATAVIRVVGMPFTHSFGDFARIDVDVYRLGAQMWRNGDALYGSGSMPFTTNGVWLPFTYPPFAALSFLPFTVVPLVAAGAVIALITVGTTVATVGVVVSGMHIGNASNRRWIVLAVATAGLWTNPFWMTMGFGQVNVVLMLLVAIDLLVIPRHSRWRGVLIGVAAAIKLTPMAFVLYLLVRREWRASVRAVVTFAALAVIATVWAPTDSVRYWGHTVFHTDRIGNLSEGINQSVNGFWIRVVPHTTTGQQALWMVSVVALTAVAIPAVRYGVVAGGPVLGVAVTATWAVMVSPTSWAHHWVWSVPTILALAVTAARSDDRTERRTLAGLAGLGSAVMLIGPFQFLPRSAAQWSVWEVIPGNAYCLWGLAVLIAIVALGVRRHANEAGGERQPGRPSSVAGQAADVPRSDADSPV